MNIILKRTKEEELTKLTEMEVDAFNVQAKYFQNGILPPFSEAEKEKNALTTLFKDKDMRMLSIYLDNDMIGCAVVKYIDKITNEIVLFFVSLKWQGSGLGRQVLQMVEDTFPNTKIWRLVTPTQVLRNSVFYVNKCGYNIVRVEEFDKQKEHGMFVFEKRKEDKQ